MGDEGFYDGDLTGRWAGHYAHASGIRAGQEFPIEAEITCRDGRVDGRMFDGITEFGDDYGEAVEAARGDLSFLSLAIARRVAAKHPGANLLVNLPRESRVEGRLRGFELRLFKTYRGEYTVTFEDGGHSRIILSRGDHAVEYRGTLDVSDRRIEGMWLIRHRGWLGRLRRPSARGDFRLVKDR